MALVEICAEGIASAFSAIAGGADRVELCENLAAGGVTPSIGAITRLCRAGGGKAVHVLIRPRGGDFLYQSFEVEAMRIDLEAARAAGTSGVVLGLLTPEGRVDLSGSRWLIEAARPMSVTFHKAFDATRDPFEALDDLIALGVDRVLTSGRAATAREGLPLLVELVRRSAGRIAVMAGGSIRESEVPALVEAGLAEIHLGSAAALEGATDAGLVRRIVALARSGSTEIYHLTTRNEWDRARAEGAYRAASLDAEGFIHASTASQVEGSANRFFPGRLGIVLLVIAVARVRVPIRWEASSHSEHPFPHLDGPLNLDAVRSCNDLKPDQAGYFRWPARST